MRPAVSASIARQGKLSVPLIFRFVPDETKHTPHNIPHNHLSGLRSYQPSPHILHALDQLSGLCSPEGRDHAEKEIRSRYGT